MLINLDRRWFLIGLITVLLIPVLPGLAQQPDSSQSLTNNLHTFQEQTSRQTLPSLKRPVPPDRSTQLASSFAFQGKGAPTNTVAGGRRGNGLCPQDASTVTGSAVGAANSTQGLTALLPPSRFSGETMSDRPTILVYVPQTTARQLVFFVEDSNQTEVDRTRFKVTGSPQILGIRLPLPLQVGQPYRWTVAMVCPKASPDNPFVEGTMQRVQPDSTFAHQLQQATPLDQASLYAKSGFWYEASTALFELQQTQPKNSDYSAAWKELLQSVGLEKMATVPLGSLP